MTICPSFVQLPVATNALQFPGLFALLYERRPSRAPLNASFPRSPSRTHLQSPEPANTRADIQSPPGRLRDARKSSRLLRSATLLSSAGPQPLRALAPRRLSPPWHHSPWRNSLFHLLPTTAPPLPASPAELLPLASSNPSFRPPPESSIMTLEFILAPPFHQRFLISHNSRVSFHAPNAHCHHTRGQSSHCQL